MRVAPERPEAPDVAQQLGLREDPRRLAGERLQQRELLLRQERPASRARAPRATSGSSSSVPDAQQPAPAAGPRAPQQRADPQPQLAVGERLRHEVVAPALEPAHAIGLRRAPREHEQRQPRIEPRAGARRHRTRAQQLQTGAVREPDVHDRQVDRVVLEHPQRVAQRPGRAQLVAVGGQVVGEERAGRGVVLDDQDRRGVVGHAGRRRARARNLAPVRQHGILPAMARTIRRTEVSECRRCSTFCDRVIRPATCIAAALPRALPVRRPAVRAPLHGLPAQGLRDGDRRRALPARPSAPAAASAPSSSRARRCGAASSRSSAPSTAARRPTRASTGASSTGRTRRPTRSAPSTCATAPPLKDPLHDERAKQDPRLRCRRRGHPGGQNRLMDHPTRRGNYDSGQDYVLEYGELRFTFNERDFSERVEQAAHKLGFVAGRLEQHRARGPREPHRQRRGARIRRPASASTSTTAGPSSSAPPSARSCTGCAGSCSAPRGSTSA